MRLANPASRLLLCGSLRLGGLLAVASNHDHAQEGANDGGAEENKDDGDADGPDAGEEEVLEGVVVVDKGLGRTMSVARLGARGESYHEKGPDGVVEKDDRGGHEHGEANDLVELQSRVSKLLLGCLSTGDLAIVETEEVGVGVQRRFTEQASKSRAGAGMRPV